MNQCRTVSLCIPRSGSVSRSLFGSGSGHRSGLRPIVEQLSPTVWLFVFRGEQLRTTVLHWRFAKLHDTPRRKPSETGVSRQSSVVSGQLAGFSRQSSVVSRQSSVVSRQWAVGSGQSSGVRRQASGVRLIAAKALLEGFRWLHAGGTTTESYITPVPLHHGVSQAKFGLVPNFAIGLVR